VNLSEIKEFWAVEYSTQQQAVHVSQLDEVIKNNCRSIARARAVGGLANDYLVVGLYPTYTQAKLEAKRVKHMMTQDVGRIPL
jgi:hypothetical protein